MVDWQLLPFNGVEARHSSVDHPVQTYGVAPGDPSMGFREEGVCSVSITPPKEEGSEGSGTSTLVSIPKGRMQTPLSPNLSPNCMLT